MATHPIGLLYDHVTDNFGDCAIGVALSSVLTAAGIPFEVVPENSSIEKFSALVVGGGHCLRASGNQFYDRFRVGGRHILNSVGISGDAGYLEFLKDYRYASVRSLVDRQRISDVRPDAKVVPCSSLAIFGTAKLDFEIEDRTILIHMPPNCFGFLTNWVEISEEAFPDYKKALLSINRYNCDQEYLSEIAALKGWKLIAGLTPGQMDTLIGHPYVHGLLTASLHGTMFAAKHSKPFLALPIIEKIRLFLEDRGLGSRVWTYENSAEDMRKRLSPSPKDAMLEGIWERDKIDLEAHLKRIVLECRTAISEYEN